MNGDSEKKMNIPCENSHGTMDFNRDLIRRPPVPRSTAGWRVTP